MRTPLLALVCLLSAQGCAMVAGHLRPIWDQSWSQIRYEAPTGKETLRVIARQFDGVPLLGTTVIARDRLGRERVAVTDQSGMVSFDLAPGEVFVKTMLDGYATHRRTITVQAEQVCVIEVFSGITAGDSVGDCCG